MAHVEKRGPGRWRARYVGPDGRERSRTFPRKIDAERWLAGVEVSKVRGEWTDPRLARITVADWSMQWLDGLAHLKPSTRATYETLLRVHVLPTWGQVPLAEIAHEDVAAWVARLTASGLSASTVRQTYRVLSLMLNLAVRARRLSRNPAAGIPLPRPRVKDKQFLTHAQVHALADAAGEYRLLVLVLAYCGLRFGEAGALRVRSVDPLRGRIDVSESLTEVRGQLVFGTPKSHERRSVPVPKFLREELAAACAGRRMDDLVFTAPGGAPLRSRNFRRRGWNRATTEAGLPGLSPHALRGTAASLAVAAGATVKDVQRMLGHASAAMTLDVYATLWEDGLDAVAERLDMAASASAADPATAWRRPEAGTEVVSITSHTSRNPA